MAREAERSLRRHLAVCADRRPLRLGFRTRVAAGEKAPEPREPGEIQDADGPHAGEEHSQRGDLSRAKEPRQRRPRLVEIPVRQARERASRQRQGHQRLDVVDDAVKTVAVARTGYPAR